MARTTLLLQLLVVVLLAWACEAKNREYFIAAEEVEWNYAPSGMNLYKEVPLDEDPESEPFFAQGPDRIGGTYIKALYIGYTDGSFSTQIERTPEWEHLGFLGPPIYAEVGDTVEVHFINRCRYNFTIHALGLSYSKEFEGAKYPNDGRSFPGNSVSPGTSFTYKWDVPARSGPGPGDWSSTAYLYTSHVDAVADTNAGLVGPIVVTAKGMADEDGRPKDVDREFFSFYTVSDENVSNYIEDNVEHFLGADAISDELFEDGDFEESNLMHGINGMLFNNLPGYTMTAFERVRWYTLAVGTEVDLHTAHWHGQTLLDQSLARVDVTSVFPGTVSVLDMVPDSPGIWFTHCHVNDHVSAGMMALFEILPAQSVYSSARNLATTYDPFYFLFDDDGQPAPRIQYDTYSSDPFSAGTALTTATPMLLAVILVCLL